MESESAHSDDSAAIASLLADHLSEAVFLADRRGRISFFSRACAELLQQSAELGDLVELVGRVHADDRSRLEAALSSGEAERRVRARFAVDSNERRHWRHVELRLTRTETGLYARLLPVDAAASETESRLHAIAGAAADAITEIDQSGTVLWSRLNADQRLFPTELGASIEESISLVHPDDQKRVFDHFAAAWNFEEQAQIDFRVRDPDDAWRWMQTTLRPFRTESGERRVLALTRDVSEGHRVLDELLASEERYRLIALNGHDLIAEHDLAGRLLYINDLALEQTGYQLEEIPDAHPLDSIHPDDRERITKMYQSIALDGERVTDTYRCRVRGRSWVWFESSVYIHRGADGANRVVTLSRDVTARMEAERALRESEERYRQLVEQSPEAIGVVWEGPEGLVAYANRAAAQLVGVDDPRDVMGRSLRDFVDPSSLVAIRGEKEGDDPPILAFEIPRPDGQHRQVVMTGAAITYNGRPAIQGVARDVTEERRAERERVRLQAQLEESRRLESLGVLAGGIAHDFNNLLTVILGNARFVRRRLGADPDIRLALDDALDAGESAARLTRQLLAYAGRREPEVRSVDLSAHTRSVSQLLRAAVPKAVSFELDLDDELPSVRADVVQLEQVIMNLVINAAEAIGDADGVLRVATRVAEVDADEIAGWIGSAELEPGRYVSLEVSDTGCGMNADTCSRIFDPFFTTKPTGHGLGLSTVLGLVRGHRGGISIDSRPGRGTTIRVFLPQSSPTV